jgi:hypothetical protein
MKLLDMYSSPFALYFLIAYQAVSFITQRTTKCVQHLCNCPSYKHSPLSNYRVLFEKLKVPQPFNIFLAFYGIRNFIAAFSTAPPLVPVLCHSNTVNAPFYLFRFVLIIFFYIILGLPSGIFLTGFPTKTPYNHTVPSYVPHAPPITLFLILTQITLR